MGYQSFQLLHGLKRRLCEMKLTIFVIFDFEANSDTTPRSQKPNMRQPDVDGINNLKLTFLLPRCHQNLVIRHSSYIKLCKTVQKSSILIGLLRFLMHFVQNFTANSINTMVKRFDSYKFCTV